MPRKALVALVVFAVFSSGLPNTLALQRCRAARNTSVDVSLDERGRLAGKLVGPEGLPLGNALVEFWESGRVVAKSATDAEGRFNAGPLQPAVYLVRVKDSSWICRAWSNGGAPPSATARLLLVSETGVQRGQVTSSLWPYLIPVGLIVGAAVAIRTSQTSAS